MKTIMNFSLYLLLILSLIGCGVITPAQRNKTKLSNIHLKMSKEEVAFILGECNEVRGSIVNKKGQVVEVWEYSLYRKTASLENVLLGPILLTFSWWIPLNSYSNYWFYFVDEQLIQWGRAGDWNDEIILKITSD